MRLRHRSMCPTGPSKTAYLPHLTEQHDLSSLALACCHRCPSPSVCHTTVPQFIQYYRWRLHRCSASLEILNFCLNFEVSHAQLRSINQPRSHLPPELFSKLATFRFPLNSSESKSFHPTYTHNWNDWLVSGLQRIL